MAEWSDDIAELDDHYLIININLNLSLLELLLLLVPELCRTMAFL